MTEGVVSARTWKAPRADYTELRSGYRHEGCRLQRIEGAGEQRLTKERTRSMTQSAKGHEDGVVIRKQLIDGVCRYRRGEEEQGVE